MHDNDNVPLRDVEHQLIGFVNHFMPAKPLLKLRADVENWLWWGKLGATICVATVVSAIFIGDWHGFSVPLATIGILAPVLMVHRLEQQLEGRWHGQMVFKRGSPAFHWHFERLRSNAADAEQGSPLSR